MNKKGRRKKIHKERFAYYIEEYGRLVFTICYSFVRNYFDAENLAQETFLSAYRNIGKFDGKNPKSWLCTIAANKCRDFLKSTAAKKCVSLSEGLPEPLEHHAVSPEDIVLEREMEERLYWMCSKLREPYKTVAMNYFCDNLKLSEVAANTGQKLKTLQMRLYRAKQILRKLWEEEFNEQSC
ncbi:MAG: RNA polymerase sigma factor [Bacillota bacterium]